MKSKISHIINIIFILLWTYTGLEKLINWEATYKAFHNQPFPPELTEILAYSIPVTELLLVLILLIPQSRKLGLLLSTLLMTVFTTYIGLVWVGAFPRIPCTCAGFIESMSWEGHLIFNGLFIALGIIGVMRFES
ncbi:MauE/DoxX family redox-associated membrane protein [Echinicola salinicaeni]|uniref:MauE/DoxX family redox-associated membrane protein n=1 Tax=Echinicola salinicaeni TaxID=2762757 RepID=UPI0016460E72|nr:MauE/DoxX family redox-associated membrane protein [Echinicola salinicaeni]